MEHGIEINQYDECHLDLMCILQQSNAPSGIFDKVISWANKNSKLIKAGHLKTRERVMIDWVQKVSTEKYSLLPKSTQVSLSSGMHINLTCFSLINKILEMLGESNFLRMTIFSAIILTV